MEFEQKKIGDICLSSCSGGTPKSTERLYYDGGTIPWLTTSEVNFKDIYDTENKITELGLEKSSAKYIPINSVIVAMYGVTAGRSAIAKIELTTNQACCNLQINEEIANFRFVYYYLMMQADQLNKLANGGAQQNLNSLIIKKFKIILPELLTQKKISQVLSNYDQLIENNNKRIKLLEQMAEELYKEWFVRFRNPLCIRNKFGRVGDICEIKSGFAYKSSDWQQEGTPVVKIKDIVDGYVNVDELDAVPPEVAAKAKNFNLNEMDLVIAMTGATIGKIGIVFKPGLSTNQRVGKIFSNKNYGNLTPFLFCFFRQQSIVETVLMYSGASSAQPNISGEMLQKINIPFSKELIELFNNKCRPLFLEIIAFKNKNENLMKQRDSLLPRLVFGKIDLEDKEVI